MRIPMAVLAGAALMVPGVVLAQSTVGPATQHNPNAFQNWANEQNAATPNGRIYPGDIYGPSPIIVQPSAPTAAAPARMPQYSMTGPGIQGDIRDPRIVSAVQQALNQRGFDVPVNGIAGTDTRNALVNYQANTGINPSGEIDRATLAALNVQNSIATTEQAPRGMMPMAPMAPMGLGNAPR